MSEGEKEKKMDKAVRRGRIFYRKRLTVPTMAE